jgi:hypothetical protein
MDPETVEYAPALHDSHQGTPVVNELYLPGLHAVHSQNTGV